jgi:hypothetical protein
MKMDESTDFDMVGDVKSASTGRPTVMCIPVCTERFPSFKTEVQRRHIKVKPKVDTRCVGQEACFA